MFRVIFVFSGVTHVAFLTPCTAGRTLVQIYDADGSRPGVNLKFDGSPKQVAALLFARQD